MNDVRLFHGDCLDVLKGLPEGSVDAVITDPPYGIGYQHSGGGYGIHARLRDYNLPPTRNSKKPLVGDGTPFDPLPWLCSPCLLWGADHFAGKLPDGGTWLAWDKSCGKGPADSFADCEFAWTNARTKRNVFRWLWKGLACAKRGEDNGRRHHPTQKPLALMRWCLEILGVSAGATVLDPFMGSGTTGVACVQTGRKFIGVEIDASYFAIAQKRIAAEQDRYPLFADKPCPPDGQTLSV